MDKKQAIKILHEMQKWRRYTGNEIKKMPYSPYTFGLAIDYAIKYLRRNEA
jgi:hypothetical protein